MAQPARRLTLLDCVAIGINGIVGSGVYLLIGPLAAKAGPASVVGILACGALCVLVALCFAELGGMFDRTGGPYLYARHAFGKHVAFGVGWMSLATGVLAFAAVSVGFADALSKFFPALDEVVLGAGRFGLTGKAVVAAGLILCLGTINYLGVKAGARTSDLLSIAKLAPLLGLALVGLAFVRPGLLGQIFSSAHLPPAEGGARQSYPGAVAQAAFLAVFMLSGFEYVSVPAGEAKEARRNIPLAIVGALLGSTALYCVLQIVALSALPDLGGHKQGLIDSAQALFGPMGRQVFVVAALISMAGFCAGSALVGPRYFTALAEDGYLPRGLTRLTRFDTPGPATIAATGLSLVLALVLGYASLVDVSNVALFGQYIPTSLAVIVLRRRMPDRERRYRLPLGPLIPVLAASASVVLLWAAEPKREEWAFSGEILAAGFALWAVFALARRLGPKPADGGVRG